MSETEIKKVLVLGQINQAGIDMLAARPDVEYELLAQDDPAISSKVADAFGLIVRIVNVDADLISRSQRLGIVARHGVGFDTIDVDALTRRGIPLATIGRANLVPVAEHALYFMLATAKMGLVYDRVTRAGDWTLREGFGATELWQKHLLVLGYGRIGARVAALARAFEMTVSIYDPYVDDAVITAAGCRPVAAFQDALSTADFVTVHTPLNNETRHIIGAAELAAMKPSAILINVARGAIVDEQALADALKGGTIRAAGIDVFGSEPPPVGYPLFGLENVLLTPHTAGLTAECGVRMAEVCAQNVLDAIDGTLDPDNVVNPEVLS